MPTIRHARADRVAAVLGIARFAYAKRARKLLIEFRHGDVYVHFNVPKHVFEGRRAAESKGKSLLRTLAPSPGIAMSGSVARGARE